MLHVTPAFLHYPMLLTRTIISMKNRVGQITKGMMILTLLLVSQATRLSAQSEKVSSSPSMLGKGVVFAGFSGGASLRESENEATLGAVIEDQAKKGFNILVSGGYMFTSDFAAGAAFRYDQSRLTKTVVDGEGIKSDIREAGSTLTSSAYVKYFIPLTANRRINIYNLAGIGWVADRNLQEKFTQDVLTRTYTRKNTLQLGLSPGIQVFVIKGFATEVGVSVAGFSASRKEVIVNGISDSKVNTFDFDLKLNILSMNISFYYYFPTTKKS
jgi:hypothetical protein